jgi:hypothetical protein
VPNLRTVELKPWPRRGGFGVFINHEASRTSNDCYVCEIPPGKARAPAAAVRGDDHDPRRPRLDQVWNDKGQRITFEWKAGALFAIPLNCHHQHFNGSGREPARFVSVTNAPIVINLYEDFDFIFGTPTTSRAASTASRTTSPPRTRPEGLPARDQLRAGRGQPAAHLGEGARRGRRPHPLQLRQGR